MIHPNIVILAGGSSSRMKNSSLTYNIDPKLIQETQQKSKSMLSVGTDDHPLLDYILFNIQSAGYKDVVIVVGEKDSSIYDYYRTQDKEKQFSKLFISYVTQKIPDSRTKPLGTADALLAALISKPAWKGKSFTVCNSDNLYSTHALKMLLTSPHKNAMIDYDRLGLKFEQSRIEAFAVIQKDSDGYLQNIIEKPSPEEIVTAKESSGRIGISMNIFKLAYDEIIYILETIPLHTERQEKELPLAVKQMVQDHPRCLMTIPLSEHVIDLTNPADIIQVTEYLRKEFPKF